MPKDMPMKGIRSMNKKVNGETNKESRSRKNRRNSCGADKKSRMKTVLVPPAAIVLIFCAASRIVIIPAT